MRYGFAIVAPMTVQRMEDSGDDFERAVTAEIRAEMARQRVSNAKLGIRIGKSKYWVGDRLLGKTRLEVAALPLFAEALGVPVTQFINVRHGGLEPPTRCLSDYGQDPLPILHAVPTVPGPTTPVSPFSPSPLDGVRPVRAA